MALRDIFKRKKKAVEKKEEKEPEAKIPEKETPPTVPIKTETFESEIAFRILKAPHITEKATDLAAQNQYVFKVYPRANKSQIKEAIGGLYNVDVVGVKIIKVPKKRRMVKGRVGWRKGYKKAIIKIKKGQKIEVMPR